MGLKAGLFSYNIEKLYLKFNISRKRYLKTNIFHIYTIYRNGTTALFSAKIETSKNMII